MVDGLTWEPGWFPDPTGRHDHRWWDGAAWTAHVADAGVAGSDPIDGPDVTAPPARAPRPPMGPAAGTDEHRPASNMAGNDPVAVTALVIGIVALFTSLLPALGLVPAVAAVILGIVARSRIKGSGRAGDGVAIAGLVIGVVALLIAVVVTVFSAMLLAGAGGELAGAFREYVSCLDVRTEAECRILLETSLARIVE